MTMEQLRQGEYHTHIALSSLELSALRITLFDPDAMPAIRAGASINLIDADDSGTLRHAVAIADYPDPLWHAVAPTFLGVNPVSQELPPLAELYAARLIPAPDRPARTIALAPAELEAALESDYPNAMKRGDAIGARIHCMHTMRWQDAPIAFPEPGDFSETAWWAAAEAMLQPEGPRWATHLLARRRAIFDDVPRQRAVALLTELHSALWIVTEAPFGAGQDFARYHANLMHKISNNAVALEILRDDADNELAGVTEAMLEAGYDLRHPVPQSLTA